MNLKNSEQDLVDLLSEVINAASILRSNQVSALDPGVDEGNFMDVADELGVAAEEVLGRLGQVLDEPTVQSVQASAGEIEVLLKQFNGMIEEQRGRSESGD